MQRLSALNILPEPGEIMDFEDIWGHRFGARNKRKYVFGRNTESPDNPTAICVRFNSGGLTETDVGFDPGDSSLAKVMNLPIVTLASTEPYGAGTVLEGLRWFVSADGKDPAGTRYKTVWSPTERKLMQVQTSNPAGLLPHTDYYITRYWTVVHEQGNPPLGLEYLGSDDPEHGGEVVIPLQPVLVDPATLPTEGFEMNLGPLGPGIFIPRAKQG